MRAGNDGIGATGVVAELDKGRYVVERLDDRADLPPDEALFGRVAQQGDGAERLGLVVSVFRLNRHHKTKEFA